jgi:hypothetical protein
LGRVVVFNGNESGSNYLDGYFIVEDEIDYRYGLGFLLRIKQNSLTSEAFRYWDQVSQAVALSGGLFEASPGPIQGNMFSILDPDEQVLGYFYASEQQDLIRFVTPEQAGRPKDLCSLSEFGGTDQCLNCVSIPLSTTQTPPDWTQ